VTPPGLLDDIRAALREQADDERAVGQQRYMKSAMPFLGVRVPEVRRITRMLAAERGLSDVDDIATVARQLWDDAEYREERYAATALTGLRPAVGELRLVPLYEHMVVSGAWWDHTDEIAHRIAELHDAHPVDTSALVRGWATGEEMWLRRLAIISQLQRRDRTDLDLLAAVIEANADDREFFIAKAIGWALRDLARTNPDWVRAFVATHDLRPLSVREATKHL
jgi:3-methyladenine DNA glycosylase AlkD